MDPDPQLAAVLHKFPRGLEVQALLNPVQDLLVAGFEANKQKPQSIIPELTEGFVVEVRPRVARPGQFKLLHAFGDFDRARPVDGKGVIVKHPFAHAIPKQILADLHLPDHGWWGFRTVGMTTDRLGP